MKILAIFAHPDDETMLCGGTLALLGRLGAQIHYLCATRGEGGEMGEPPLCRRDQLGEMRLRETACAVQALGGGTLEFLDYKDPVVGPDNELYPFTSDFEKLIAEIRQAIRRIRPQVVLTHGSSGEYGHPAHKIVHQTVCRAVGSFDEEETILYSVQAAFKGHPKPRIMNRQDSADLVLDITPALEAKIQATLCHRTQHAAFVRNASRLAGRPLSVPEIVTSTESLHRIYPCDSALSDGLAALLLDAGFAVARKP